MTRLIPASLLLLALAPTSLRASNLDIDTALSDVLKREGIAPVEVTLDLTGRRDTNREHPAADSGVHPTIFDIAMMAAPGPLTLNEAGTFHTLNLVATESAVNQILEMNEVVALRLDSAKPANEAPVAKSVCPSTSTRACLQSNFSVSTNYGGVSGKVASVGGDSASFWAYSSNNWEVLAKVLNGCGINNHWWLLGAAAGTNTYSIFPTAWVQGGSLNLPSSTATNKPIVNLSLLSCS